MKRADIYIFDASSIYESFISNNYGILYGNITLNYAIFELGNIIYKHTNLLKIYDYQEAIEGMKNIIKILRKMKIYRFHTIKDYISIINFSLKFNITFYDAAYVYLAYRLKKPLITEDVKLREKVKDLIQTFSLKDILE
ncbi:hypothetical protein YN1_2440 [Nanoarchaeota archaeon]